MIPIDPSVIKNVTTPQSEFAREPTDKDQAAFNQALDSSSDTQQAVGGTTPGANSPVSSSSEANQPTGKPTLGDQILSNIQNVNQDYQNQVKAIDSATEASDAGMNPGDLLKMEYEVSEMTVEQQVTSKIGDSASQGVQQLFKNQ
jgi:Type III secretion basal body protein I, YscI, HrpB, PscI